jgi:hypothetical protein
MRVVAMVVVKSLHTEALSYGRAAKRVNPSSAKNEMESIRFLDTRNLRPKPDAKGMSAASGSSSAGLQRNHS